MRQHNSLLKRRFTGQYLVDRRESLVEGCGIWHLGGQRLAARGFLKRLFLVGDLFLALGEVNVILKALGKEFRVAFLGLVKQIELGLQLVYFGLQTLVWLPQIGELLILRALPLDSYGSPLFKADGRPLVMNTLNHSGAVESDTLIENFGVLQDSTTLKNSSASSPVSLVT